MLGSSGLTEELGRVPLPGHEATLMEKVVKVIRNEPGCALLLHPIAESAPFYAQYRARIAEPMDFDTLQANVASTAGTVVNTWNTGISAQVSPTMSYEYLDEFARDARRIFSNAIRYNSYLDKSSTALRKTFISLLYKFEARWLDWNKKNFPRDLIAPPSKPLKLCLSAVETALATLTTNTNLPKDIKVSVVSSFIDPVHIQLGPQALQDYLQKVGSPVDMGTIIEKLVGGAYDSTEPFLADVQRVADNCRVYWEGREQEGGNIYIADAQAMVDKIRAVVTTNPQRYNDMPVLPPVVDVPLSPEAGGTTAAGGSGRKSGAGDHGDEGCGSKATKTLKLSLGRAGKSPATSATSTASPSLAENAPLDGQAASSTEIKPEAGRSEEGGAAADAGVDQVASSEGAKKKRAPRRRRKKDEEGDLEALAGKLEKGDKVMANYKYGGKWYPGKIEKERTQGTYDVRYDDGDREQGVERERIRLKERAVLAELPPLPTSPPPRQGLMEKNNFWLPPQAHTEHESDNQLIRRAQKYIVTMAEGCLAELQNHYMVSNLAASGKVSTCGPFLRPVDPRYFPDYVDFMAREGREIMNLQVISRKLRADKYSTKVTPILEDMKKVRDNAHAYNVGDENIELRLMADATYNYFHYLIKRCVTALMYSNDTGVKEKVLDPELMPYLDQPTQQDVLTYLKILDDEHVAAWNVWLTGEKKKRALLDAQRSEAVAALKAEQEAIVNELMGANQPADDVVDMHEADDLKTIEAQLEWGIDLGAENYEEPLTLHLGSKSKTSKSKSGTNKVNMNAFLHEKKGWELTAVKVMEKITKHPLVDMSKPDRVLTDFFHPVVDMFPQLAEQYLSIVSAPMDLTMLTNQLNMGTILDAEEFYEKLSSVFLNLALYNSRGGLMEHEKFAAEQMVKKGNHLADYVKWLCLESFSVKSAEIEEASDRPEMLGCLRASQVIAMREAREAILQKSPLSGSVADCKKLLASLKRTKGKQETIAMGWFCVPVVMPSDYSVYVRKPMDLGTVQKKLHKGLNKSHEGGYMSYGEFLNDLRLTFKNSIKYNAVHMQDEGSATVHKAASNFLGRLEELLPSWTVDVAEKCQREAITASHEEQLQREQLERLLEEKRQLDAFAEQELARRLAEDRQFQDDMDVEKKKAKTEEERKEQDLHEALLRGDSLQALEEEQEQAEIEGNVSVLPAFLKAVSELRIQGVGCNGQLPSQLIPHAQKKHELLENAWEAWEPLRQHGVGVVKADQRLSPSNAAEITTPGEKPKRGSTSFSGLGIATSTAGMSEKTGESASKRARKSALTSSVPLQQRNTASGKWRAMIDEDLDDDNTIQVVPVNMSMKIEKRDDMGDPESRDRKNISVKALFM